jgi:hypothetical protein
MGACPLTELALAEGSGNTADGRNDGLQSLLLAQPLTPPQCGYDGLGLPGTVVGEAAGRVAVVDEPAHGLNSGTETSLV